MQNYSIANRSYTMSEVQATPNQTTLFDLSYLSVITLQGEKSAEFLQGQLTCDVRKVNAEQMRPAAQCNLKGRVLSLPDVVYWDNYHLILPDDLRADTINSLSKPAMLSRVSVEADDQFDLFGLHHGTDEALTMPHLNRFDVFQDGQCFYYAINDSCTIVLVPKQLSDQFTASYKAQQRFAGSLDWHSMLLSKKRVEIYPSSRGLFLPHRLDLHLADYLAFDKGCYKGQEIIARTHYRATLKHKLAVFQINTSEPINIGQKLLSLENAVEIGELVDYSPVTDNRYLIAATVLIEHPDEVKLEGHHLPIKLT